MNPIQDQAKPFYFPGNHIGCLLIHGFTGTPFEMRELGEHLAGKDYTVLGPRLFGHGTHPDDIVRSRWWDWYNSALDGYTTLESQCEQIYLIGLSLGGSISLLMGTLEPVNGVCAIAAPYTTPNELAVKMLPFTPVISRLKEFISKGESDWVDKEAEKTHSAYPMIPVRSGAEAHALINEMRVRLPDLTCPLLLIYSTGDGTIPIEHSELIFHDVSSEDIELKVIKNSGHNIPRDAQRAIVFEYVSEFIHRHSGA